MSMSRLNDSILNNITGNVSATPIFIATNNTVIESIVLITSLSVTKDALNYTEIDISNSAGPLFTISTEDIAIGINITSFVGLYYELNLAIYKNDILYFEKSDNNNPVNIGNIVWNTNERRF